MRGLIEKEVNGDFEEFVLDWNEKFEVLVGGQGWWKRYEIGLKVILKLVEEKGREVVIREVYETDGE